MDIANIFKSKTRKAIFRLYFTNSDKEYYLRELERLLKIPVSMIRKELQRLEDEGLFKSRNKANLTFFSINKEYPLFEELKSIVQKTIGVGGLLKQLFEKEKNVKIAFIYGSFAKGDEKSISDIDLFIVGNIDESKLVSKINRLEKTLRREINYTLFSQAEFKRRKTQKDSFVKDLLKNQKIFLVGDKNDL